MNWGTLIPPIATAVGFLRWGVAFLVMMPVLYTDASEAWKLTSRRQRLAIGLAASPPNWGWLFVHHAVAFFAGRPVLRSSVFDGDDHLPHDAVYQSKPADAF